MCDTRPTRARGSAWPGPRWGVLYALTIPQLTVLAAVEATQASHPLRAALRCAVALGVFIAMGAWVHVNRAAFDLWDWCDCAGERMTVRVIHSRSPRPAEPQELPTLTPADAPEREVLV